MFGCPAIYDKYQNKNYGTRKKKTYIYGSASKVTFVKVSLKVMILAGAVGNAKLIHFILHVSRRCDTKIMFNFTVTKNLRPVSAWHISRASQKKVLLPRAGYEWIMKSNGPNVLLTRW